MDETTTTPTNGGRITYELRSFTKDPLLGYASQSQHIEQLTAIADRIDAALAEHYVELPKDADGEYIHLGDVMEWCDSGDTLEVVGIGADDTLFYFDKDSDGEEMADWTSARNKRHHHKQPTVEDVLREFAEKITDSQIPGVHPTYEEAIAKYAKRLKLTECDAE